MGWKLLPGSGAVVGGTVVRTENAPVSLPTPHPSPQFLPKKNLNGIFGKVCVGGGGIGGFWGDVFGKVCFWGGVGNVSGLFW